MKITMLCSMIVNGVQRAAGESIDVSDPRLIGALLENSMAEPADPLGRALWRASRKAPAKNWIKQWRH
jgi:hypothetical protein